MAGNKKPSRKPSAGPRKPRIVTIPNLVDVVYITSEDPWLEVKVCGALEGFLHEPTVERGNDLCHLLCQIAASINILGNGVGVAQMKTPEARTVVSAVRALEDVTLRHRRIGGSTLQILDTERTTLLAARRNLVVALDQIPVHVWHAADVDVRAVVTAIDLREKAKKKLALNIEAEVLRRIDAVLPAIEEVAA